MTFSNGLPTFQATGMSTGTLLVEPVVGGPEGGARPRLLLLHGFLGSGSSWNRVARELEPFADVVAPDLRGHGAAKVHEPGFTLEQVVDDLAPIFWEQRPTHVVGHSMGALVALAAASTYQGPSRRLGLIGLPVFASPAEGYGHQAGRGSGRRALLAVHRWSHPLCVVGGRTTVVWAPVAARFAPRYPRAALSGLVQHSSDAHSGALDQVVFGGLSPSLAAANVLPVAALHGTDDAVAPIAPARALAVAHGWRFEVVSGASHQVVYERPVTVARWIARRVLFGGRDESRSDGASARGTMPGS